MMINRRRRCRYTLIIILMGIGAFYIAQIVLSSIFGSSHSNDLAEENLPGNKKEQDVERNNMKNKEELNQDKTKAQSSHRDKGDDDGKKLKDSDREPKKSKDSDVQKDKSNRKQQGKKNVDDKDAIAKSKKVTPIATTKKSINIFQKMKIAAEDQIKKKIKQAQDAHKAADERQSHDKKRTSGKERPVFQPALPQNHKPAAPGEYGRPVDVPKEYQQLSEELFQRNHFNQWVSDRISLQRTLPDPRPEMCKSMTYPVDLPSTSVVIVFYNEAWSTLMRTVHSVLDRSPPDLLHEVILVDDSSDVVGHEELHQPLEEYVRQLDKVRLHHNSQREGLIRARLRGLEQTSAPIVTFLDAHCEVTIGWLEPLLNRIHQDRTTVVCPEIDSIDLNNFAYKYGPSGVLRGTFNWDLSFKWSIAPTSERLRRTSATDPMRSPTMAGGLFAIDREYFLELGTYDRGLEIWGAENMELSFKVWQCGGKLEIIPCSHVGHVFREVQPYDTSVSLHSIANKNYQRVAEVWMDDYKKFFYQRHPYLTDQSFGDISENLKLRQRLKCRSFRWYLQNVFTDVILPNETAIATGKVRNPISNMCLDTFGRTSNTFLGLSPCNIQRDTMLFAYTSRKEISWNDACLDASFIMPGFKIQMAECHRIGGNQKWLHQKKDVIKHVHSGLCIDRGTDLNPVILPCNGSLTQVWTFDYYTVNSGNKLMR